MESRSELIDRAAGLLRNARRVCVLTGAGISAESGIPTFRDAQQGLWASYDPMQLATPEGFAEDPELVWGWYESRREYVRNAQPNPGHYALADLARRARALTLVTQNVDGLHQRAGSTGVVEYHGNILRDRCTREHRVVDRAPDEPGAAALPRCAVCGALLRPDVVWFGELIPQDALLLADAAASDCDVFLSVGTSSLVYPAAGLAESALRAGASVIEVNPNPTDLSRRADVQLRGPAGTMLPALLAALVGSGAG
ncbi:MAG TPA: NAD-dependent deacylase [Steroidobacteraceae bacterium]|nr:NAD-dependent deacylase [Steroidobacteraceae bacterium]